MKTKNRPLKLKYEAPGLFATNKAQLACVSTGSTPAADATCGTGGTPGVSCASGASATTSAGSACDSGDSAYLNATADITNHGCVGNGATAGAGVGPSVEICKAGGTVSVTACVTGGTP